MTSAVHHHDWLPDLTCTKACPDHRDRRDPSRPARVVLAVLPGDPVVGAVPAQVGRRSVAAVMAAAIEAGLRRLSAPAPAWSAR